MACTVHTALSSSRSEGHIHILVSSLNKTSLPLRCCLCQCKHALPTTGRKRTHLSQVLSSSSRSMTPKNRKCGWCGREGGELKLCNQCKLVDYCGTDCQRNDWNSKHKVLCAKVPKAVTKAEEKIQTFSLSDYTTRNIGTFMVTEAQASRGEIIEEAKAQDMCYDAMEMRKGSAEKIRKILKALDVFPLSTEAWGMLGHFYQYEVAQGANEKNCSTEALKMYDNSILCARILNPSWTENRRDELIWGEVEHRPYLRSLHGRALCLKNIGQNRDAIRQAKKIILLNPGDNQGVRMSLCAWLLEARDTEGCTNLLRKYDTRNDTFLAYADVLLQYIRWMKDDAVENDVRKALYVALKRNPFVPDFVGVEGLKEDNDDELGYSPGGIKEAKMFALQTKKMWGKYEAIKWMQSLKFDGSKIPNETNLITLLRSGTQVIIKCINTDLNGSERRKESTLLCTQKKKKCIGCALPDFFWPRQLNQPHKVASDIIVHNNDFDANRESRWRKTKYVDVLEVPFWKILLQFCNEDDDDDNAGDYRDEPASLMPQEKQRPKYENTDILKCKECSSDARFCALDNDCTVFYCGKTCMKNYLQESEPPYFDLRSETLKVSASEECSIRTLDLDFALEVAGRHMPNLHSVDIFINQQYVLKDSFSDDDKNLVLSSTVLKKFLERMSGRLISFIFRLDDCCWEEIKDMTDRCKALQPLGAMPHLKKLNLSNFGFDDVGTLTSCLSPALQSLSLDYVKMGPSLEWTTAEVDALVLALSQLTGLVTLSLPDSSLTDNHVRRLLPNLKELKCLDLSGCFGNPSNSPLSDVALRAIADHCPKLVKLAVDYQGKGTASGVMTVFQKCHDIVELSALELDIGVQHIREILKASRKLLLFSFGGTCSIPTQRENSAIQNAVEVTEGRVVVCTGRGLVKLNLSHEHKRNQDDSIAKVERSNAQAYNPTIINEWDGIL